MAQSALEFLDCASWSRVTAKFSPETNVVTIFDGMAELWFDDFEALLAARQSAEWKASNHGRSELCRPQQGCLLPLPGARHSGHNNR